MTRAVITGADGFLGRAVARGALERGWDLLLVDQGFRDLPADLANAPRNTADLRNPDELSAVVTPHQADVVIHLAAYGVGTSGLYTGAAKNPGAAVDVNVRGLVNILHAAAAAGVPARVVLASSTTVYGPASDYATTPVTEDVPLWPRSVYGATKAASELVARPLAEQLGLSSTAVRLPLVYGPGRWYGGSQESLVAFVRAVAGGDPAVIAAWTADADWIHVRDAAESLLLAAEAPAVAPAYNVVGHRGSLASLAEAIAAHATDEVRVTEAPEGDPGLPLLDDGRIRAQLGFTPRFDSAAAGAQDYVATEGSST